MAQLTLQQAMQNAFRHHQAGRLAEAEQIYRQVLSADPDHADALHLLGVIAQQTGRCALSAELIRRAVALRPDFADAYANLGNALSHQGKLNEAIASYRRAIELNPNLAEPHGNLGNALRGQGKLDEAVAAFRRAVQINPASASAYGNLGITLRMQGKLSEAVQAYLRSIELNPKAPETHSNLGNALSDQRKFHEAIAEYTKAIQLKPDYAEAHSNLGNALRETGKLGDAIAAHRRAVQLKPDYGEAYYNLAIVQQDMGNLDEAEASLLHAIRLTPDHPEPHNNLGSVRKDQGRMDEALGCYQRAMKLNPNDPPAYGNFLYGMHFHPGYDRAAIYAEHVKWNELHCKPLQEFIEPYRNDADPDRRLKIGYVSPDFRSHPVGRFMLPLLANHSRANFEVYCYADVRVPDSFTARLQTHAAVWRDILGMSDAEAARQIRGDGIDILIDLTMHMQHNRMPLFARKPAPVQVSYLAYCSTTGLETIDYRLTDAHLDPPEWGDGCYSERSVRLPRTYWCYEPQADCPPVGSLPALNAGHVTFGCLNNFCKISPGALDAWGKLVAGIPRSRLILHAKEGRHRQSVLDQLHQHGVEHDRVQFFTSARPEEYFRLYNQIDIALDPFPYCGGTTTCDAFWMGVPVISLAGATAVGRAGVSLLTNVGLPELIAHSSKEYINKAAMLAGDLQKLASIRAGLRDQMRHSPLTDAARFAADMETAYRSMWRQRRG